MQADPKETTPEVQQEKPQKNFKRELFEWLRAFIIALAITVFITQVLIINARVPSRSMEDAIHPGDRLIGLRFSYWFNEPQRGDIVIFRYPDDEEQLFIKRVIGLPGDTVTLEGGAVYINGEKLDESAYLPADVLTEPGYSGISSYVVPQNAYFCLGDNRTNSQDARYWINTFVTADEIVGKAVVRIFPSPTLLD